MTAKTALDQRQIGRRFSTYLGGMYEAWEASDAEAFVADSSTTPAWSDAACTRKPQELRAPWPSGSRAAQGITVIDQPQDVRFPNEDTAIVISEGGVVFPGRNAVPSEGMVRATWVLAKRGGRWYVAAYHYSPAN